MVINNHAGGHTHLVTAKDALYLYKDYFYVW